MTCLSNLDPLDRACARSGLRSVLAFRLALFFCSIRVTSLPFCTLSPHLAMETRSKQPLPFLQELTSNLSLKAEPRRTPTEFNLAPSLPSFPASSIAESSLAATLSAATPIPWRPFPTPSTFGPRAKCRRSFSATRALWAPWAPSCWAPRCPSKLTPSRGPWKSPRPHPDSCLVKPRTPPARPRPTPDAPRAAPPRCPAPPPRSKAFRPISNFPTGAAGEPREPNPRGRGLWRRGRAPRRGRGGTREAQAKSAPNSSSGSAWARRCWAGRSAGPPSRTSTKKCPGWRNSPRSRAPSPTRRTRRPRPSRPPALARGPAPPPRCPRPRTCAPSGSRRRPRRAAACIAECTTPCGVRCSRPRRAWRCTWGCCTLSRRWSRSRCSRTRTRTSPRRSTSTRIPRRCGTGSMCWTNRRRRSSPRPRAAREGPTVRGALWKNLNFYGPRGDLPYWHCF